MIDSKSTDASFDTKAHAPASNGLPEERGASILLRALPDHLFVPGGRHNDRWRQAGGAQPLLQLDAGHARELHVDHNARGRRRSVDVGFS